MARTPAAAAAAATEQGGESRERILVAALKSFSQSGFDGATVREIAARADVNLGLLQYYFGGKLGLWRAAVDRAFGELEGGLRAVLEDPSVADDGERLRLLIRGQVAFVARHPEFVRLMHDEGKRRGPRMRWLVDRHVKPLHQGLLGMIRRAQEGGFLPAGLSTLHLAYILVGSIDVIFHQAEECKRLTGIDPTDPDEIAAHARAVEHLFLGSPNL